MRVAGIDEAGRGPLAGPVVCAAVILPEVRLPADLNDSKQLSERQRETLFDWICQNAVAYRIEFVSAASIDRLNILQATLHGMRCALEGLATAAELALIDGNRVPAGLPCPARAVIGGDALEPCIMAASVLAKVSRDRHMQALDALYPGYGFAQHKGYPTAGHRQALQQLGACPEHRRSYAPVQRALQQHGAAK